MKFIQIILENSQQKEAKLYTPAKKAMEYPDTGITIQNKSAYHVIKDSATMAVKYLPHFVFGCYIDPFKQLKGKFKKDDINEFVTKSQEDFVLKQLLDIIVSKIDTENYQLSSNSKSISSDASDPYGEYGASSNTQTNLSVSELLCLAFGAV